MNSKPVIQPVILSGGSGTRLWPLSQPEQPKQLLALTDELTMLQLTARRVRDEGRYHSPIVVCGARHAPQVGKQLAEIGVEPACMIVEPVARNTAPAIALAAASVPPETLLLVMPSDHVIEDVKAFRDIVMRALPIASDGWIVTLGIEPDRPETGYGYIRRGEELTAGVYQVERFVEKPSLEKARAYLVEGACSWNGGIFLFRAADYIDALVEHAPDILRATRRSLELGRVDGVEIHPDEEAFGAAPSISIDYAILERIQHAAVAPIEMGWSDIGSWDALYDFAQKDERANAMSDGMVTFDCEGSLVRSTGPLVATIGVKDLIILATPEAVLVMPRGDSQRVKEVVAELEAREEGEQSPRP